MRRNLIVGIGVALVAIIATAVTSWAVISSRSADGRTTPALVQGTGASTAPAGGTALADTFAALRAAATPSDALPAQASGPTSPLVAQGGDLQQARRVATLDSWGVWLVPGANVLCLYSGTADGGGGSSCSYASAAGDGFLQTLDGGADGAPGIPAHELLLAGVVPNGVDAVQLQLSDGTTKSLDVRNNIYVAIVPDAAKSVSYSDANGPQERLVPTCGGSC